MKAFGAKENFRISVRPRCMADFGSVVVSHRVVYGSGMDAHSRWEDDIYKRCLAIAEQIRRHCDDVDTTVIKYDQDDVCEHCLTKWTEDSGDYNGGCCDKDCEEQDARVAASEEKKKDTSDETL